MSLIHNLANQVIRERFTWIGADDSLRILMLASGYDLVDLLRNVGVRIDIRARNISYLNSVMYGLNPVKLDYLGITLTQPYQSTDHGLSDPLQLASFFAVYGMKEEANLLLQKRQATIDLFDSWSEGKERGKRTEFDNFSWAPRSMFRTWVPPDFEELGLPRVKIHRSLDSFYMEGAFEFQGYMDRIKAGITPQNIEALAIISGLKNRELNRSMRAAAYEQARKLATSDKSGGFRYADMATYIRLCDPEDATILFDDLRGVRQMLALVRHDTREDHYLAGLRQLAQAETSVRKEILERMGRGPSIEEVRKVRSSGIVTVLDEMDWKLLEPIAQEKGLRAAALPFAEKLGPVILRRFLSDHDGRVKRIPNVETEPAKAGQSLMVTSALSVADWEIVMERLHKMWTTSISIRRALWDATNDDAVSFLALLDAFGVSSPDIQEALKHHPNWGGIQKVLDGYTPPNQKELWS